jgi:hypothetical protein
VSCCVSEICTPDLYLRTCYVLNDNWRSLSTREPNAARAPLFTVVRGQTACAWAVRADVPANIASELDRIARDEPASDDFRDSPAHAQRYLEVLAVHAVSIRSTSESDGPIFRFPDSLLKSDDVVAVDDESILHRNFRGWVRGEIEAGRGPVMAIVENGAPVSVCFCARRSDSAAEAGVETAKLYRGRGFGARVSAAWALAIRATGRVPLYSTSWANQASLGVARKVGLVPFASVWSIAG